MRVSHHRLGIMENNETAQAEADYQHEQQPQQEPPQKDQPLEEQPQEVQQPIGLESLNYDCLLSILKQLSIADLYACSQVSRRLRSVSDSFHAKAVLKTEDDFIKTRKPSQRTMFLRSLIPNVGHHLNSLFLNFEFIQEKNPSRMMHIIQDNCTGTLKHLSVIKWLQMELDDFKPLLAGLELLHMEQCTGPSSDSPSHKRIAPVLRELLAIKTLSIIECESCLYDSEMAGILENKIDLNKIQLVTPSVRGFHDLANTLSTLPNLQYVSLHIDSTKMLDLVPLADIQDLRSLQLTNYTGLSMNIFIIFCYMFRDLFNGLSRRNRLEELVLHHCRLDDVAYKAIANIRSLRHIALRKHYWADNMSLRRVANHGRLRSIDLFDCAGVNSEGVLEMVIGNPSLAMLDVSWCCQMNNEVVRSVYEVLQSRPKTGMPFELFLGGSNRVEHLLLPKIDSTVLTIWFDAQMKLDVSPTQNANMMLSEVEKRVRNTMMLRIRTLTVDFMNSIRKNAKKAATAAAAEKSDKALGDRAASTN